jgi:hypothetical protein
VHRAAQAPQSHDKFIELGAELVPPEEGLLIEAGEIVSPEGGSSSWRVRLDSCVVET